MNIPDDPFFTLLNDALAARGAETLQRSLYAALRDAILCGQLQAQSWLPGSRTLAERLSISRNTVNVAFCANRVAACLATAMRRESGRCGRRLPGIWRYRGVSTAMRGKL